MEGKKSPGHFTPRFDSLNLVAALTVSNPVCGIVAYAGC